MKKMWLVCLAMVLLVLFATTFVAGQDKSKAEAPKVTHLKTLGHYPLIPGGSGTAEKARVNFRASAQFIVKKLAEVSPQGEVGKELAIQLFDTDVLDRAVFYDRPVKKGEIFPWMIYRGGLHIQNVMWIGDDPMQTFAFKVRMGDKEYEFAVPKACGNVCLLEIKDADSFVSSVKPESEKDILASPRPVLSPAVPVSIPAPAKRDNLKLKLGYGFNRDGLTVSGPCFNLERRNSLADYLPMNSYLFACDEGDSGWLYTPSNSFSRRSGDIVSLGAKRWAEVSHESQSILFGLEARISGDSWFGVDYAYSGLRVAITEEMDSMRFEDVQYLGYYPISSTHVWFLKLDRWKTNRVTEYTISAHELDFTARYEFRAGRISLIPFAGLGVSWVNREMTEDVHLTITDPWRDRVQSLSESQGSKSERVTYVFIVTGLSAEAQIFKNLRLGVEATYRAMPDVTLGYKSWTGEGQWSVRTLPWQISASLKLVI